MAIYNLHLNSKQEYMDLVPEIYKYSVIILIFHILMHSTYKGKAPIAFGLTKELLNNDFLNFFMFLLIGFLAFHLVAKKIIDFH